jgi:hypothetical protein
MRRFERKKADWKQVLEETVDELPLLQRVIASGLMTEEEDAVDESLADRFGTTRDAVRIERQLATRKIREALYSRGR